MAFMNFSSCKFFHAIEDKLLKSLKETYIKEVGFMSYLLTGCSQF